MSAITLLPLLPVIDAESRYKSCSFKGELQFRVKAAVSFQYNCSFYRGFKFLKYLQFIRLRVPPFIYGMLSPRLSPT